MVYRTTVAILAGDEGEWIKELVAMRVFKCMILLTKIQRPNV